MAGRHTSDPNTACHRGAERRLFFAGIASVLAVAAVGCASSQQAATPARRADAPSESARAVADRAEQALTDPPSQSHQAALRADLERHLRALGVTDLRLLTESAAWSPGASPAGTMSRQVVIAPAVAATSATRTLVVSRDAEFDTLESSIVISLGDLRARSIRNCILLVAGLTEADQLDSTALAGSGRVSARVMRDCTRLEDRAAH